MSIDPETLRQIEELSHDSRPLLVVDVDEVVLEFVDPFVRYLENEGFVFATQSFRLTGNVIERSSGRTAGAEETSALLDSFFAVQARWQSPLAGVVDALRRLAGEVEVVMLTAMPHRHHAIRRAHLDSLAIPYPLLTTEMAKGPAISRLRGEHARRVAFIDDLPHNLVSVRDSVPQASLFHLMANAGMRAMLPPLPEGISPLADWSHAEPVVRAALTV